MNQIANMFKAHGIKKDDCVAFYVHTSFYAVASIFACARLGIVYIPIYAEFPAYAISYRINEAKCVALITDNQGVRNGKLVELKSVADEAIRYCPSVKYRFVIDRTNADYEINEQVINLRRVRLSF
jgi:acetyl-CoA synthetase